MQYFECKKKFILIDEMPHNLYRTCYRNQKKHLSFLSGGSGKLGHIIKDSLLPQSNKEGYPIIWNSCLASGHFSSPLSGQNCTIRVLRWLLDCNKRFYYTEIHELVVFLFRIFFFLG